MKLAPRGPFQRIRWFCNDGSVLPPRPYACSELGGGVQHGEWNERIRMLRANGYLVGNVLAAVDPQVFRSNSHWLSALKQILLEQFLIDADEGWIFRQARYYPGALQTEDENASGRALLLDLLVERGMREENFLVMREAVRLLPHGRCHTPMIEMRQLARSLEERDPGFNLLRVKLHVRPDGNDAERVRDYAAGQGLPELGDDYRHLADLIDDIYRPQDIGAELLRLKEMIKDPALVKAFREAGPFVAPNTLPYPHMAALARLMTEIRVGMSRVPDPRQRLALLDLSLDLETAAFQLGNSWLIGLPGTERRQRLAWLRHGNRVLFGMGLISNRELQALDQAFAALAAPPLRVRDYLHQLDYLARLSDWAENTLHFHFSLAIDHLVELDPLVARYIPDRLRGSPLVSQIAVLESLRQDASNLAGVRHRVFGQVPVSGLRPLNPGLARGILRIFRPGDTWDPQGIYLLPETLPDLPPVSGLLTEGWGNALSHVQILARNLGIPNVAIEPRLAAQLYPRDGLPVVLAVSPGGMVVLEADGPQWAAVFASRGETPEQVRLRLDPHKPDLNRREFIPLDQLRAQDSGRLVGPKAANLGELKYLFPELVTEGLAIPFGLFRDHLEQPMTPGGPTVLAWMRQQQQALEQMTDPPARAAATETYLAVLRNWFASSDPGMDFRRRLSAAMRQTFGPDGSYGVFVRSDTNVEDLPGFSGAGLNLTVPHVIGFENVVQAIMKVWASPFSARAYAWREAHLEQPAEVLASVLLLRSVPVDKSGVLVTMDPDSGSRDWLAVAVNEGIGGAVAGQRAEELLIGRSGNETRLLAQASEPQRRVLLPAGGLTRVPAAGGEAILSPGEIRTLREMAGDLSSRFPGLVDAEGQTAPADIEFGFLGGRFVLFQIRPFLTSPRAAKSAFLRGLDRNLQQAGATEVELNRIPEEAKP